MRFDPVAYWISGWAILRGDDSAKGGFDLSPAGFWRSFMAIAFALPVLAIAGFSALREAARLSVDAISLPALSFAFILAAMTFPPLAKFICYLFKKNEGLRDWIIIRNWVWLAVMMVTVLPFALNLAGALPYEFAVMLSSLICLAVIWADYRVIRSVLNLNWGGALISACVLSCGFMWTALAAGLFLAALQFG